ncbi:hypothetical protein G7078_04965 [Sphingomonas sinipercae]|uniref:Uncharacterized protein n=1 Tax=Sphingomonas sinipercae TaxID=2714944 RepID=A0A6G7ZMQ5_9SPHN|nr:hypothetical protein [Sphingomonas sinipercae]QIL02199.1 hypothetical protein G7078_04965 [Sphingomonas sinipercae]
MISMIGGIIGITALLLFVAAQGLVVFVSAYLILRVVGSTSWAAKGAAMLISYVIWVAVTIVGYSLIGGDGGLMDGFGMVLTLCFCALISSIVYLLVWAAPSRRVVD